mgnify:CR=1 FL=1
MDIDIRKAVLHNMNKTTFEDVKSTVDDAIQSGEEKMLPGLGVLFEVLYNSCDEQGKNDILNKLTTSFQ